MKTKEEIIDQLIDEVYKRFPNESYSDWDIAEYVYDKLQPKWIKIESEEDLPKEITECFVYDDDGDIGYYTFGILDDDNEYIKENGVTHYMPIIKPEPPKED